jgi:hypothetical protein
LCAIHARLPSLCCFQSTHTGHYTHSAVKHRSPRLPFKDVCGNVINARHPVCLFPRRTRSVNGRYFETHIRKRLAYLRAHEPVAPKHHHLVCLWALSRTRTHRPAQTPLCRLRCCSRNRKLCSAPSFVHRAAECAARQEGRGTYGCHFNALDSCCDSARCSKSLNKGYAPLLGFVCELSLQQQRKRRDSRDSF